MAGPWYGRPSLCAERVDHVKSGRVALSRQHCDNDSRSSGPRVLGFLSVAVACPDTCRLPHIDVAHPSVACPAVRTIRREGPV